ncbi:MAG TPA: M23 family metallopeptidase [Cyclobacteriaceae bacterium]
MHKLLFVIVLILVTPQVTAQEYRSTVDMRLYHQPGIVTISGKTMVYYELYITNFSGDTLHLKKLHVLNAIDSSRLYSMKLEELKMHSGLIGNAKAKGNLLSSGNTMVVYFEVELKKSAGQLIHELELEVNGKPVSIHGAALTLSGKEPVVLGAPLKGGPWVAVYNPEWERGHRRVIYTIDGRARIPGRHAIDFILLNEQGHFAEGDENVIQNWLGYAKDVLAVKDGIVLATRNDFKESATLSDHTQSTADQAAGNYVSINIGEGKVVFYEHLQPGSVRVKPGQKVKKGEVIASLGFTGQTTGPHLHFHVADANSTLGAEGLPFEFEKFTHLGTYFKFEEFGKAPWTPEKNQRSTVNIDCPAPNSVIRFPF